MKEFALHIGIQNAIIYVVALALSHIRKLHSMPKIRIISAIIKNAIILLSVIKLHEMGVTEMLPRQWTAH